DWCLLTRLSLTAGYDTVAVTRQPGTFPVRARPRVAGPAARAVPAVRPAQPGRHRLHAPHRPRLRAQAAALVGAGGRE
ncbi:MAG TPA: hypothetical protein VK584_15535, partial [Streptosporangiaceae bacterium]|nr:hypothetical protein [Streptosporangiaceae bacterium]